MILQAQESIVVLFHIQILPPTTLHKLEVPTTILVKK